jgi:endonuclease-3
MSRPRTAKGRARETAARLALEYPGTPVELCALRHDNPFQLLAATILSAQTTDERVNMVTPELFRRYPTAADLAAANPDEVEAIIKSTGFFRNKTKSLIGMSTAAAERHSGEIPREMDTLVKLPGVGRKTANVVLGNAFDTNAGVVVDTHVTRLSQRLGLTKNTDPVKIEQDLIKLFPSEQWTMLSHLLIEHGRQICEARRPKCEECLLNDFCPSSRTRPKPARGARRRS